jgi:hypothetical protein
MDCKEIIEKEAYRLALEIEKICRKHHKEIINMALEANRKI